MALSLHCTSQARRGGNSFTQPLISPARSPRDLHLHLISLDFASPELKRSRHFNIFNSDYLVPPSRWADELAAHGVSPALRKINARMFANIVAAIKGAHGATILEKVRSEIGTNFGVPIRRSAHRPRPRICSVGSTIERLGLADA